MFLLIFSRISINESLFVIKNSPCFNINLSFKKSFEICHLIFEVLGEKRRKKYFNKIIKTQDVFCVPSIKRLILKHAVKYEVDDEENLEMIKDMIFNGLTYDFFGADTGRPTEEYSEKDFDIIKNDGTIKYKIIKVRIINIQLHARQTTRKETINNLL